MALVPLDSSNQLSLYGNNKFGSTSNPLVQSFSPKTTTSGVMIFKNFVITVMAPEK